MKICLIFVVFLYRYDLTKEPVRCCGSSNCVSLTERVAKLLDPDVLEIQIGLRYRDRENNSEKKPENYRFVAYRNLFILTYGRTRAKEERKPLPSCLVMRVRNLFPDPNDKYTGFKSKKKRKKWIIFLFLFSELLWQMRSSQTSSQRCLLQSVVAYSGVTATDPGTLPCHRDQPAARMERIPSTKTAFSWCRWELWWRCSGRQIHYLICSIFSNCLEPKNFSSETGAP